MNIKSIMTTRFCLSFGLALSITSVLVAQRDGPAPSLDGEGVVYAYYASLCAAPGDSRDCHEIARPVRPVFSSLEACSAHADVELKQAHDPRVMASCMRERES